MQDLMGALTNVMDSIKNMNSRMVVQEEAQVLVQEALQELQPRVSILFNEQDDKDSLASNNSGSSAAQVAPEGSKSTKARKSMFQRNIDETATLAERHEVIVQRQTPSHSHIYLNSTDLAEYAKFVNKWFDWEIQHGIKLEPALIVSRNVRNLIMYNNGKTETDFNSLTPSDFCSLMAKETKVFSKVHFAETFRNAMKDVKVLFWDNVRPNTHELFFQGVLRRQKLFLRTFQILMEANKSFCPALEGREFGLAQIFLDLIDKNYNKYILAEIPKVKDLNYSKLSDFVDAYVRMAKDHFEAGRSIRLVPYGGNDFKMAPAPTKTSSFKPDFKGSSTFQNNGNNRSSGSNSSGNNYSGTQRLHFVDVSQEVDDSGDETHQRQIDKDDSRSEASDNNDDDTSACVQEHSTLLPDVLPVAATDDDDNPSQVSFPVQQLQTVGAPGDYVKGCINFALYGNCFQGDACKNAQGHSEKVAKETRQWMVRKLTSASEKSSNPSPTSSNFPRKIVQRERPSRDFE